MTDPMLDVDHWDDDVPDGSMIITDGSNVTIAVRDGHLVIRDGVPSRPRVRRISRTWGESSVTLVQLGEHGYITFEAYRWMRECGMSIANVSDAPRFCAWRSVIGQARGSVECIRYLVRAKIQGQSVNLDLIDRPDQARKVLDKLKMTDNDADIFNAETAASRIYWHAWNGNVRIPWRPADQRKNPDHWDSFKRASKRKVDRSGKRQTGSRNANATDPLNAMLNFGYWVGEDACRRACIACGLHPGLGVLHAPRNGRDSFALDVLEAVRPVVDAKIIRYLRGLRWFDTRWCHETGKGVVRLDPPLTHVIGGWSGELFDAALPVAVECARILQRETR